jgi:hypothetical protein
MMDPEGFEPSIFKGQKALIAQFRNDPTRKKAA